jgi:hypothetical protein
LNTLQNDGVHGCPSSTLQGACENGVGLMPLPGASRSGDNHPGDGDDETDDDTPEHETSLVNEKPLDSAQATIVITRESG